MIITLFIVTRTSLRYVLMHLWVELYLFLKKIIDSRKLMACNNPLLAIFSIMELGFCLENLDINFLMSSSTRKVPFSEGKKLAREVTSFSFGNLGREPTMEIELNNPFKKLFKSKWKSRRLTKLLS